MKKLILIPLLLSLISLISCASFTQSDSGKLLVQYATVKFITSDAAPLARAQKVMAIASEAKIYFDSDTLPLSEIEALIRRKIKWDELDAADTLLANALILTVSDEVQNAGTLPEDKQVSGSTVLGWIIDGARLVGG